MQLFLLNILLAFFWAAVSGSFTASTLITGFVFGYLIMLLAAPAFGPSTYIVQIWRYVAFVPFFIGEIVKSSVRVAVDVLTPGLEAVPAVVGYPLELKTDAAITVLSSLISLTPGTLSLDVSSDRQTLYVHAMYDGDDLDTVRSDLRRLEVRVQKMMEPGQAMRSRQPGKARA